MPWDSPADVEFSVAHRPGGVSAVVDGVEVLGLARRVDAVHVDHQIAVAPLTPGVNAGNVILGGGDPGVADDDVAVSVVDEPAFDRLGGDEDGPRGAEDGPQVVRGEKAKVEAPGENRGHGGRSGGALEDPLRLRFLRAEGERGRQPQGEPPSRPFRAGAPPFRAIVEFRHGTSPSRLEESPPNGGFIPPPPRLLQAPVRPGAPASRRRSRGHAGNAALHRRTDRQVEISWFAATRSAGFHPSHQTSKDAILLDFQSQGRTIMGTTVAPLCSRRLRKLRRTQL